MPLWFNPLAFLIFGAFFLSSSVFCEWHTISPAASDYSYGFESSSSFLSSHSSTGYYRCPSVVCLRTFYTPWERIDPYVHFMVGTAHPSSVPLTVYRLCDLFQHCLDRNNFMITVHITKERYPCFLFCNQLHLWLTLRSFRSIYCVLHFHKSIWYSLYQNSVLSILQGLDVPYQIWEGNFTSTFKMLNYLNLYSW